MTTENEGRKWRETRRSNTSRVLKDILFPQLGSRVSFVDIFLIVFIN